ncbi:sensor histidine kinase [Chondrinema litorale]|uniref:sensor histidine kinase n=1 Tax=Chondrinema litorale TaxID=2994555 RepID=UPI00254285ED|nr:histidine kinase [Chondrinema litorale]UZR96410.1 histidine kinase [Chondrinema litorale]
MFFIHNIVIVPIKFEEGKGINYLIFSIICIIAFAVTEVYLFIDIINTLNTPDSNIFNIAASKLFSINNLINTNATISFPLLVIAILSVIYCLLVYGYQAISPYLEAFFHIIALTLLFALLVTIPNINKTSLSLYLPLILTFYINTFGISPLILKNKIYYLLGLLTLILSYFLLQTILLTIYNGPQFNPETGKPFTQQDIPQVIFSLPNLIILSIILFLSFVYSFVRIKIQSREKSLNIRLGEKESELKLLKSQVNPHFLFNSLNTLYATALSEKAEKTGTSIAKLANLIRYMQKDINRDFIPLENEIKYITDYISIQKLRCAIEPQVETTFINIENQLISPGIFIPFVENAFKYGIDPSQKSTLHISITCKKNEVHFICVNSYNDDFKTFYKEQGLGIGIKNAQQRLELVYPKKHTFEITKIDNKFTIKISITIQRKN